MMCNDKINIKITIIYTHTYTLLSFLYEEKLWTPLFSFFIQAMVNLVNDGHSSVLWNTRAQSPHPTLCCTYCSPSLPSPSLVTTSCSFYFHRICFLNMLLFYINSFFHLSKKKKVRINYTLCNGRSRTSSLNRVSRR